VLIGARDWGSRQDEALEYAPKWKELKEARDAMAK
jgi:hypothetical protein